MHESGLVASGSRITNKGKQYWDQRKVLEGMGYASFGFSSIEGKGHAFGDVIKVHVLRI